GAAGPTLVEAREIAVDEIEGGRLHAAPGKGEGGGGEIFLHRQVLEDAPPFHDVEQAAPHEAVRRVVRHRLAVETNRAGRDRPVLQRQQARYRLQRRRLAGAVGAEERDDLATLHGKRQAAEHLDRLVVDDLDVLDGKDG